ncbi:hypothetical protein DICVIV_02174 [Dictyocaulus viviparus]|uniref:I/LWEQ domain-containing protein n=1 Tax=Dictyocaulus viviparus TaxID=29172 RepID=A0A0D8Y428_DICVI|nr:hypothetical protein DICVIV_02174 [Dictyocaulus viviparus]
MFTAVLMILHMLGAASIMDGTEFVKKKAELSRLVMDAQEQVLRKEKELVHARERLANLNKARYERGVSPDHRNKVPFLSFSHPLSLDM